MGISLRRSVAAYGIGLALGETSSLTGKVAFSAAKSVSGASDREKA